MVNKLEQRLQRNLENRNKNREIFRNLEYSAGGSTIGELDCVIYSAADNSIWIFECKNRDHGKARGKAYNQLGRAMGNLGLIKRAMSLVTGDKIGYINKVFTYYVHGDLDVELYKAKLS